MSNPKVSVCVPAYNQARYLPKAIESVLSQTYENLEIIVVDDGSTDDTLDIAHAYAAKYRDRVFVLTHPDNRNLGPSATVNRGLREATGEYCSLLGSDDILYPHKTERQVRYLQRHPEVDVVYSTAQYMDASGKTIPMRLGQRTARGVAGVEKLIQANRVADMTVMFRRTRLDEIGFLNESIVYGDWEFWIRMAAQVQMAFIDEPLVRYRIHNGNISVGNSDEVNFERALEVMAALLANEPHVHLLDTLQIKALINFQCARYRFCLGQYEAAAEHLRIGFKIYPGIDVSTFARWMTDVYLPRVKAQELYPWLSENIPEPPGEAFRESIRKIFNGVAAGWAARESYEIGAVKTARQKALEAFRRDPHLLTDWQLLTILGRAMFGPTLLGRAKSLKRKLASKKRSDGVSGIGDVGETELRA